MGWSRGSDLAERLIAVVFEYVPSTDARLNIYHEMIEAMTDLDWDTIDEVIGMDDVFDQVAENLGYLTEEDEDSEEDEDPDEEPA